MEKSEEFKIVLDCTVEIKTVNEALDAAKAPLYGIIEFIDIAFHAISGDFDSNETINNVCLDISEGDLLFGGPFEKDDSLDRVTQILAIYQVSFTFMESLRTKLDELGLYSKPHEITKVDYVNDSTIILSIKKT